MLNSGNQYLWQARSQPLHQAFAPLGKMDGIEGRWPEVTEEVKLSPFGILHKLPPTLKVKLERVREVRVAMGFEGIPLGKAV